MVLQFFYLVAISIVPLRVCRVQESTALHPYAIHVPLHLLMVWLVLLSKQVQSTLVISKSKGPSKILRNIRTSTY